MNFKFLKNEKGFTLVELLAAIMVVGVISGVVGSILISSLVGSNKTNSLEKVRQGGNFALLQISKAIEFSRNFYGVSIDGVNYVTDCTEDEVSPTPTPAYNFAKIVTLEGNTVVYSCESSTISSNGDSLIDNDALKTTSCFFTCSQDNSLLPPSIGINFDLSTNESSTFLERNSSVSFSTSVTLRNLNR